MPIRFSNNGPAFPERLVDAMLAGEVVFLCGAGISAPQLDDFKGLVEQCFVQLKAKKTPAEEEALNSARYEEVLGSLGRRIVNHQKLIEVVAQRLKWQTDFDLGNHETILRLSRDTKNQPTIVTTNFDVLLEQALRKVQPANSIRAASHAGQDLPQPGSADFGGIIHLHGRIADESLQLEQTPLVLTSADYGDAYMRSAWASRFLFDLCRCKTLVLIGYSAGDAPVRYFLNVLEADRQRFTGLRSVYAFDVAKKQTTPDTRWETLAVEPIFYRKQRGTKSHAPLWRDLKELASLVERPRSTRRAWAKDSLKKTFSTTKGKDLDRIAWLFKGSDDLWEIAVTTIADPSWFDFFDERQLWTEETAARVKAAWVTRDLQSRERLKRSIHWLNDLGKPFADALAVRLDQHRQLPQLWFRAWCLLTSNPPELGVDWLARSFPLGRKLESPELLSSDLQQAIDYLTPIISFSTYDLESDSEHSSPTTSARLRDILQPNLELRDAEAAKTLFDKLRQVGHEDFLVDVATTKLRETLGKSLDIEGIEVDYDSNNFSVPSIEPHTQNEYHDGPVLLVQLLADLYPKLAQINRTKARAIAEIWRWMPGLLGVRLWLHAMRCAQAFSANEAMESICLLSPHQFWTIRRELLLLLKERASEADATLVSRVEQRILTEGMLFYQTFSLEPDETEWRPDARDSAVWLFLQMLKAANRLSVAGADELHTIQTRQNDLNRAIEEADYFDSYSSGIRRIEGNAHPIQIASENERLEKARDSLESPFFEDRLGWSVYCRTNPEGAFDTLKKALLNEANAQLWKGLIGAILARREDPESPLVKNIFEALEQADSSFLVLVVRELSHLYCNASLESRRSIPILGGRLFNAAIASDTGETDYDRDLYSAARDSVAGRLTDSVLRDIKDHFQKKQKIDSSLTSSIESATVASGRQGLYAQAMLVSKAELLVQVNAMQVLENLSQLMKGTTPAAIALRSVLVTQNLSPLVTSRFRENVLLGVTEGRRGRQQIIAANIFYPALSIVRQDAGYEQWDITLGDVANALRQHTQAFGLRESFLNLLHKWAKDGSSDSAINWTSTIAPLLECVWPSERALHDEAIARQFAKLALGAGDAFPAALQYLKDYLTALPTFGGLVDTEKSVIPTQYPDLMTDFLWRLFGTDASKNLHGMRKVLDQLVRAKPALEVDRRIQNLYRRVPAYE